MADQSSIIAKNINLQQPFGKRRPAGFFFFIAMLLFFLTLAAAVGIFLYEKLLTKNLSGLEDSFKRAEAEFEPSLIAELTRVSKTIDAGKALLAVHPAMSRTFEFLEQLTLADVRFSSFAFSRDTLTLSMRGEARGYSNLSQQAAMFEQSPLVEKVTLSNLSLLDLGTVGFAIKIVFLPSIVQFP